MQQRACVALCLQAGYSTDEAAQILGIKPATVCVHVHRARATLRTALEDDHD